jgi:hypothetical protein
MDHLPSKDLLGKVGAMGRKVSVQELRLRTMNLSPTQEAAHSGRLVD